MEKLRWKDAKWSWEKWFEAMPKADKQVIRLIISFSKWQQDTDVPIEVTSSKPIICFSKLPKNCKNKVAKHRS